MPYVTTYGVPQRPAYHGPVNMYAHPPSPVMAPPTSPPAAWRQTYLPQQMPVLNQHPIHVSCDVVVVIALTNVLYQFSK